MALDRLDVQAYSSPQMPTREKDRMAEETRVKVTLKLPQSLVRQAKHYCVDRDADLQDVVAEALHAFLARKRGQ